MNRNYILKSLIILLISIFSIMILTNNVEASSTELSATATQVTTGQQVTVIATVTSGAWNLSLTGAGQTKGLVGQTNTTDNSSSSTSISFTPNEAGEYKFALTGDVTDYVTDVTDTINKSITITVKAPVINTPEPEPEKPTTNNNTQTQTPPATVKKSSEARLSKFWITPKDYDFSGFSKNTSKENWSAEVPNNISEVEVYATAKDSKAKVEGTGKVTLKEGANPVKVKVTAEDGTTKTYTLTITRKSADEQSKEDGEARLKSLGIKPEEYDFTGFDSEKAEYSVEVPNEVEEIEVYAKAINSNAQITGTGMITLEEGENELKIEVIAVDGTKKTYTLSVTRAESEETTGTTEEPFGLSSLSIKGLKLSPSFKVGTHEYTATLTSVAVEGSLEVIAKANSEDATVEIMGNENLQQGENVITILVKNQKTEENATYQIIVNYNIELEEIAQNSWLKPETWGQEEKIKIAIIVVLIILIIIAIILKIKISKESNEQQYVELPGGEELDKAITEHQELSEESNYEDVVETTVENNNTLETQGEQNYIEEIAMNKFGIEEEVDTKQKRRGRHF